MNADKPVSWHLTALAIGTAVLAACATRDATESRWLTITAVAGYELLLDASSIAPPDSARSRTAWVRLVLSPGRPGSSPASSVRDSIAERYETYRDKGLTHEQAVPATLVDLLTIHVLTSSSTAAQRDSGASAYDIQIKIDCSARAIEIVGWRFGSTSLPSELSPPGTSFPVPLAPETPVESLFARLCTVR